MNYDDFIQWNNRAKQCAEDHPEGIRIKAVPLTVFDGKRRITDDVQFPCSLADAVKLEGESVVFQRYVTNLAKEYQDQWREHAKEGRRLQEQSNPQDRKTQG